MKCVPRKILPSLLYETSLKAVIFLSRPTKLMLPRCFPVSQALSETILLDKIANQSAGRKETLIRSKTYASMTWTCRRTSTAEAASPRVSNKVG